MAFFVHLVFASDQIHDPIYQGGILFCFPFPCRIMSGVESSDKDSQQAGAAKSHVDDDASAAAAAKKKAKAKAKRARQRARKKANKKAAFIAADQHTGSRPGYYFAKGPRGLGYYRENGETKTDAAQSEALFINRTRRATAGKGRGQGLFATAAIGEGGIITRARPVLSTVFDPYATSVCAFCFRTASTAGTHDVELTLRKDENGRLGVFVDEQTSPQVVAILNGCAAGSANENAGIQKGDIVASVDGTTISPGQGALQRCIAALGSATVGPAGFKVVVTRPSLQPCSSCNRCAVCVECNDAGRLNWHQAHECQAFMKLPAGVKRGESSPIRMMLRYRATVAIGDWAPPCPSLQATSKQSAAKVDSTQTTGDKEPLELMTTLQANKDVVPEAQKTMLAKITGIPAAAVSQIISQIRGNACSIQRGAKGTAQKIGCALSVFMGYSNHDCEPNAEACVDDNGSVHVPLC